MWSSARALLCAFYALSLTVVPAGAENSSWFAREDAPAVKKAPSPVRPAPTSPAASPANQKPLGNAFPSVVTPSGDDAAYIAFDQGQYLTALKLAEEGAARGEAQSYTLMARIYAEGLGVAKNEAKAVEDYKKAVDLGDVPAAFALGVMLAEGRGIEKNREAAALLFEKAAMTGHAEANYNLGLLFLKGDGKPENPIRAGQHIRYAAEKGVVQAQYDLASLYQTGTGVEPDALEAAKWMAKAADQGLPTAEYDYAVMLLKGMGLKKDEPRAPVLLKTAAEKGIAGAQNRYSYVLLEGIGVQKDPIEAAKWRLIAQRNGVEDKTLDEMVAKLSKADRQKAEAAAVAWTDRIQIAPTE